MNNLDGIKKCILSLTFISMIGFYVLCFAKKILLFDIEVNFVMITMLYMFIFFMNYNSIYKERAWSCYLLAYVAFMPGIFSLGCSIANFNTISFGYAILNIISSVCLCSMLYLNNVYRGILEDRKR